ncbi:unnamed protein product [Cyberlindnera jadinii]|uniref:Zn(2)-C6 fungal-type domain-containing protein n=1 Tax=Cyberlindnera jadinii (strain ATCC 18201 / CBS 1600 / BCRC 20928 / JCM 3617 / NBRC 0987 / NRRL Y-1542) TaxID=983966 RepID=A0A0H5C4L0_CYBJN|nr:unnamed protein product [Cyberlindnera jadinii]
MGKIKTYTPRSRAGCVECKQRRIKCDEGRPQCQRCVKRGLGCHYTGVTLLWEEDARKRGIAFGRSADAITNKDRAPETVKIHNVVPLRQHYPFLNVCDKDMSRLYDGKMIHDGIATPEGYDELQKIFERGLVPVLENPVRYSAFDFNFGEAHTFSFDDIFLESFAPFPVSQLLNPPETDISQTTLVLNFVEKELVSYFIDMVAPHCVCCKVSSNSAINSYLAPELNPYLYLIIPLSLKSRIVMKTIVVASSTQLVLLGHHEYSTVAEKYLEEIVHELPLLVESTKATGTNLDEVFAVVIMLCFAEISAYCSNSWLSLLNYAKKVLKESSGERDKIMTPMARFFIRYFISHEVMGETAWEQDSSPVKNDPSLMMQDDSFIQELKKDGDNKIDLVFGCSPYLVSLVHRITVIRQCFDYLELEVHHKDMYNVEILNHSMETQKMLSAINQQLPDNSDLYFNHDEIQHILIVAEIKRLTALLYLHGVMSQRPEFIALSQVDHIDCTNDIIALTKKLPECYMSLLWPIFIVGLVIPDIESVRWFVLDSLQQMERKRKLKTVEAARETLLGVWKEKDLGVMSVSWKEMIKGKTSAISLA